MAGRTLLELSPGLIPGHLVSARDEPVLGHRLMQANVSPDILKGVGVQVCAQLRHEIQESAGLGTVKFPGVDLQVLEAQRQGFGESVCHPGVARDTLRLPGSSDSR
jgi:hypothetical protein